ncbi:MAG: AAA family ATPase, partial [Caldilineaceae bacterium]|nr:AAA family ATPase [Caldilineaceae bacterium]
LMAQDVTALQETLALYRGPLLADFSLPDAPHFEAWKEQARTNYQTLAIHGLVRLSEHYLLYNDQEAGLPVTQQLLAMEPWNEVAHRHRMLLLAASGRRADALAQYALCQQALADELGVVPESTTTALYLAIRDGEWPFRTVAIEEQARRQDRPTELIGSAPEVQSIRAASFPLLHNLPNPLTPFLGRRDEVHELSVLLGRKETRLVTLFGEGGIGKTRLAIAVGQALLQSIQQSARSYQADQYAVPPLRDGIWFVSLAGLSPTMDLPEQLAAAIAQALGAMFHGTGSLSSQIQHYLQYRRLLLILDNFEELVDGCTFLLDLLRQCVGVKLLLTSRRLLDLQAEIVWPVEGLAVPKSDGVRADAPPLELSELHHFAAVALFVERMQRVQRTFRLSRENWRDVVAICQLSEGIPLFLELAAAQSRTLTTAAIRHLLETEATTIVTTFHDLPDRHRSLIAVLTHSWQLLTVTEQRVLSAL